MVLHMADFQETRDTRPTFDERMLPELVKGQLDKLNEVAASVESAIEAANKAEEQAKEAKNKSAGRGFFTDKKRVAIEELQSAGIDMANAVQASAKAQKTSFEFQTRLAEIAKYLFSMGVRNIAANRLVVRELEARLKGASEEEISELARQEIMAVVMQLKDQEDLLKKQENLRQKQEKMADDLTALNNKTKFVLTQTDELDLRLKSQEMQQRDSAAVIESLGQLVKQQQQESLFLQQQLLEQRELLNALRETLVIAEANAKQATSNLRSALNQRTSLLVAMVVTASAAIYFLM